jgi:hypothetical protein
VGEGADERARAVSDWRKKKKGRAVDGGPRRLTGRKRELGHAVITGRMRERPAGSWAAGWKRDGGREGWGLGFFLILFQTFKSLNSFKTFHLFKLFSKIFKLIFKNF